MRRTRVGERSDDEGKAEVDTDVVLQHTVSAWLLRAALSNKLLLDISKSNNTRRYLSLYFL